MDYDNLSKIRAQVSLFTNRKTSNVLDGDFTSVFRGRSLDFDDLREYAYGDNIKDIDWKSSSKTGKTLVRRFIAEKKHNVLFVVDTGEKMLADTSEFEEKSEIAIDAFGTIAYLVDKHGDDFALMQDTAGGIDFSYFKSGAAHFENLMVRCRQNIGSNGKTGLGGLLDYIAECIRRNMVIVCVTDMAGMQQLTEKILRKVTVNNDLLIMNIEDETSYEYESCYDHDIDNYDDNDNDESSFINFYENVRENDINSTYSEVSKSSKVDNFFNSCMITKNSNIIINHYYYNMSEMFCNCISLTSLPDISKWNTDNMIDMSRIFINCESLSSLPDISKWNTNNLNNMNGVFANCVSLTSLPDISKWNTNNVKYMIELFYNCGSLSSLPDISK